MTTAIFDLDQAQREALTLSDKEVIASVLTWDMQQHVTADEIITIAIVHDILWIRLTRNRAVPIALGTFNSIRSQQLAQQSEADVAFVMQLEAKLQGDKPQIEVDSAPHGVYRVWRGIELLGTFYRYGEGWIAEPAHGDLKRCTSAAAAQSAIVRSERCKEQLRVA